MRAPYPAPASCTVAPASQSRWQSQATIADGRRMSTAHCYLTPIRNRPNLHIVTDALTEQILLDGTRCAGVRYSVGGKTQEAKAGSDVVISAGSVNSPQLLELSGIGQPKLLQGLGIEVRQALPGVGENLRDHFAPRTRWAIKAKAIPTTIAAAVSASSTRSCVT